MITNVTTVVIDAPKQKVWDVLTKPELVKSWQYGSDLLTSWQVGTPIRFVTAMGTQVYEQWGEVLEVNQPDFIKYSLFAPRPGLEDKPENYFIMKYVLTDLNGKTKLDMIMEDDRSVAVQEDPQGEESPIIRALKELAEKI